MCLLIFAPARSTSAHHTTWRDELGSIKGEARTTAKAAIRQHGSGSFVVVPVCYAIQGERWLLQLEADLIVEFGAIETGYNVRELSFTIGAIDEEHREALSVAATRVMKRPGHKKLISETTKAGMADPDVRKKVLAHLLDPDFREATAEASRAYHAQEEVRAAYSARMADPEMQVRLVTPAREANRLAGLRAARATEESRARTSEASTRMWEDPAYRARQEELRADPATRERMSQTTAERFTDPAERAKTSAATRAALADPEVKLRTAAAARLRWANPDYREKMRQSRLARQSAQ